MRRQESHLLNDGLPVLCEGFGFVCIRVFKDQNENEFMIVLHIFISQNQQLCVSGGVNILMGTTCWCFGLY